MGSLTVPSIKNVYAMQQKACAEVSQVIRTIPGMIWRYVVSFLSDFFLSFPRRRGSSSCNQDLDACLRRHDERRESLVAVDKTAKLPGLLLLGLSLLFTCRPVLAELTLSDVERLALENEPAILALRAKGDALLASSIAEGQLPDPKLAIGIYNVPLDDFDLKEHPTTQFRTRIEQAFPRGDTLEYQQQYTAWMGRAETERAQMSEQMVIRDVRQAYLELYYQLEAEKIVAGNRDLFQQLVDVTRVMFASGRVSQQDVLRAQLELSRLDERSSRIVEMQEVQRAALGRWIGEAAWQKIETGFPLLEELPEHNMIKQALLDHPVMRASDARVTASEQLVHRAREQYKPGWNIGLEYRKRFGNNPDGTDREDMMAAMLMMDLPLFTEKRQDKRLASSQKNNEAAKQQRDMQLRELQRMLAAEYSRWTRLGEQQQLYKTYLLEEASQNNRAALNAYQSGTTGFNTLMRASITELDVRLQELRIRVDRAKTQARLLYLVADTDGQSVKGAES